MARGGGAGLGYGAGGAAAEWLLLGVEPGAVLGVGPRTARAYLRRGWAAHSLAVGPIRCDLHAASVSRTSAWHSVQRRQSAARAATSTQLLTHL